MKTFLLVLAFLTMACHSQAAQQSCRAQVGQAKAAAYVLDCRLNSMARNSPCNELNPCSVIVAEVVRSCNIDMPGKPDAKLCEKYRKLAQTFPIETAATGK